jgi:hypothetical protein
MQLKKDQKSSLFFLFFAVAMMVSSVQVSLGTFASPGSGLLAFLAASLLALFSIVNLIVSRAGKSGKTERPVFAVSEINWKNLVLTLIALFAFPFVLKPLGFGLTMLGFMLFMAKVIGARKWPGAIVFSLSTTVVSYLLFVYWLKFFVDKGVLGIY